MGSVCILVYPAQTWGLPRVLDPAQIERVLRISWQYIKKKMKEKKNVYSSMYICYSNFSFPSMPSKKSSTH